MYWWEFRSLAVTQGRRACEGSIRLRTRDGLVRVPLKRICQDASEFGPSVRVRPPARYLRLLISTLPEYELLDLPPNVMPTDDAEGRGPRNGERGPLQMGWPYSGHCRAAPN